MLSHKLLVRKCNRHPGESQHRHQCQQRCFVLIDLKIGDLTHQDLGQMQMYVHYYERELMNEGDNPPIGIVLCADKSESVVKYTLPENETQIFASKYKLYLPSEEELSQELQREYRALEYDKEKSK